MTVRDNLRLSRVRPCDVVTCRTGARTPPNTTRRGESLGTDSAQVAPRSARIGQQRRPGQPFIGEVVIVGRQQLRRLEGANRYVRLAWPFFAPERHRRSAVAAEAAGYAGRRGVGGQRFAVDRHLLVAEAGPGHRRRRSGPSTGFAVTIGNKAGRPARLERHGAAQAAASALIVAHWRAPV